MNAERAVFTVADIVSQLKPAGANAAACGINPSTAPITPGAQANGRNSNPSMLSIYSLTQAALAANRILNPDLLSTEQNGIVKITSLRKNVTGNFFIDWPTRTYGAIDSATPAMTPTNHAAGVRAPYYMPASSNYIGVEVYTMHKPLFLNLTMLNISGMPFFQNTLINTQFFIRPRNGDLTNAPCDM